MLTIGLLEVILRASIIFIPNNPLRSQHISRKIDDKILGHRPNPKYPEHDENGFRNEAVPQKVDIVAMGDSQTYGAGIKRPWPQQAQDLAGAGLTVYNMSFGGYGPVHSLVLLDEALELKPKVIIEAFYAGNDLFDSFNISYYFNDFDFLKTHDKQTIATIQEYENIKSLQQKIAEVYRYRP